MASEQQLPPSIAAAAVLQAYTGPALQSEEVKGYDFNKGVDYDAIFESLKHSGFQATNFGQAIEEVKRMLNWRLSDEPVTPEEADDWKDPKVRANTKCTIFLSYTSNMASAGTREVIRYLVQHKMVDCVVSTAGGIEEDFIKCLAPTHLGEFSLDGATLRAQGLNRIGNLLVPNDNYCKFQEWIMPLFDEMLDRQKKEDLIWTPSSMIKFLGEKINDESSIYYWCAKNDIPVYSPAITDGSIGDMLFFHSFKNPGLIVDIVQDIRGINSLAIHSKRSGAIILGGGLVKHHVLNANLMRNGCHYAVFINTANEFDGSDSGARPDEAVSWGKIAKGAKPVKIYGEATLLFPLLVAQTFAKLPNHKR